MYLNPDDGCKIKDILCGRIMVMMKLKLAKSKTAYEAVDTANGNPPSSDVNNGTKILKKLV